MNSLLQTSTVAAIATLLAAAGLVLLHRLRVQPVRRPVATLLFWQSATREQASRSLWGRLSRLRTFLFLLAILLLLGLSLSGLRGFGRKPALEPLVLVIDSGFSMSAKGDEGRTRTADAVALARADAENAGDRPLALIEAGDVPKVLASFRDPTVVTRRALESVQPSTQPADRSAAIRLAASLLSPAGTGQIVLYTDRPLPREPLSTSTRNALRVRTVGAPARNSAVLSAFYVSDAWRAGFGAIGVRLKTWGEQRGPLHVRLTLGTGAASHVVEREAMPSRDDEAVATFEGLPADGRVAEVELVGGDALAADDRASIRLPSQPSVAFNVEGAIPPALAAALSTIDSNGSGATVIDVLQTSGPSNENATRPVIVMVKGGDAGTVTGGDRIVPTNDAWTMDLPVEGAIVGRGVDLRSTSPTAVPLLRAGDAVVAAVERDGRATRLLLSDALFAEQSTLPRRPGFVLLLGRAVRSMAGWTQSPVSLPLERRITDPTGLGDPARDANLISGSRSDSDVTTIDGSRDAAPDAVGSNGRAFNLSIVTLVGAIGLLMLEGLLYATKRIV